MSKNGFVTVVLAGDHTLAHEGMRQVLTQHAEFKMVEDAGDGEQAVEAVKRYQPDIVLLDIPMSKLNGIELVRRVKSCCPDTRALLLTDYEDDDDYSLALKEAGASACVAKTVRPAELLEALRSIHSGETISRPVHSMRTVRPRIRIPPFVRPQAAGHLSAREIQVLQLAAQGLHNRAIAGRLDISVRTVEAHLGSIFIKLHVTSRTEAILHALSHRIAAL